MILAIVAYILDHPC